jgi:hypothetical protein
VPVLQSLSFISDTNLVVVVADGGGRREFDFERDDSSVVPLIQAPEFSRRYLTAPRGTDFGVAVMDLVRSAFAVRRLDA